MTKIAVWGNGSSFAGFLLAMMMRIHNRLSHVRSVATEQSRLPPVLWR